MTKRTFNFTRNLGHRSGFEDKIAAQLRAKGIDPHYEAIVIAYTPPLMTHKYTPDFLLPNGIIIETKGYFLTQDRTKHKNIKREHPDLDIRFVFENPNTPINKGSPTSYAKWCEQWGFAWAKKSIPEAWLNEPINLTCLKAIEAVTTRKK